MLIKVMCKLRFNKASMSLNEILSQKILYRKGLFSQNLLNIVVIENGTQSLFLGFLTRTNRKVSEDLVCLRLYKVFSEVVHLLIESGLNVKLSSY